MSALLPARMRTAHASAHAWASAQVAKAHKFVRELSVSQQDEAPDVHKVVQASDNNFFERITSAVEAEEKVDDELTTIKNLSLNGDRKELEDLYVEALYTIVHKVGKEDCESKENLIKYVRHAFQADSNQHLSLLEKARCTKPPVVLLNIQLLEGRDLIAKDVNGFSDPFAMMGIVPGKRDNEKEKKKPEIRQVIEDDDCPHSPKSAAKRDGMLHRFGGSFRRKMDKKNVRKALDSGDIPAKLIKASSVQHKTLNPRWNEKFQFIVDDVAIDSVHVDIWDHDDEDRSVLDSVSSLNQVKGGFKGLGRYFKEVAQSARNSSEEGMDDFLGSVTIKLNDIPPDGMEQWFTLQPRSEKSKVSGQVRLKMWLSTKEERIGGEEDDLLDIKEHIELIRQFALYEIRTSGAPVRMWDGTFNEKALTILRQHAIQGDLTQAQTAMCKWLAFASMILIDISFTLLNLALTATLDNWKPMTLDKEEEDMLTESFASFDAYCKKCMMEHRVRFAPMKRNSGEEFASLVKCVKNLRESQFYQKCMPHKRLFNAHLESLIIKSAEDFFDKTVERLQHDDPCVELLRILAVVNVTCSRFLHFAAVIRELTRIDYSQLTLATFDKSLNEYLCSEMMSERKCDLKAQMKLAANQDPVDEEGLLDLVRIHIAFVELRNYRLANRVRVKDESEWAGIFDRGIGKFLALARQRATARVVLACQLDVPIAGTGNDMRHSSSNIDVCHIVEQMTVCWERLEPSELMLKIDYTKTLVDLLCDTVTLYVNKVLANLEQEGFAGDLPPILPSSLLALLCSAINNCEQVRRSLLVHEKLHLDDLAVKYEKDKNGIPLWRADIEGRLEECDKNVCGMIDASVQRLTQRLLPQMKKHVFHLAWSPSACPVEDAIKPLSDMLDIELSAVHRTLLHRNFLRVMSSQVATVVSLLQDCVGENPGMEPTFYQRLYEAWNLLSDFFHAGGKGITMEQLETTPAHINLVKLLSLNQTPTEQLIEKYYKDLLKQQNEVSECKYGILNVRAYYNSNSQTLVLDVIGAKQVIPLDANGLSDPFVIIELVPKFRYAQQSVFKTKVVSKSLNPIFDETFEFHIPSKVPPCAMLHFTVMDHDYLRSNDFAGEAFLELNDIPGFGTTSVGQLRQFNLVLIQPVSNSKEIVEVLRNRAEDKEAQEFLRSISTAY